MLRVARFAARFGFEVAPETEAIMRAMVAGGELAALTAERVWQELARALLDETPSRFFAVLRRCGALSQLLPEVDALFGVSRPAGEDAEIDAGVHCMRAVDHAAAAGEKLPVRYAVLASNLGQPASSRARPETCVAQSVRRAAMLSRRLKAPADCRELIEELLGYALYPANPYRKAVLLLGPGSNGKSTLLGLFLSADALRRPERFEQLLRACAADRQSSSGSSPADYPPAALLAAALGVVRGIDAGAVAGARPRAQDIPRRVRSARLKALREWMRTS